MNKLKRLAIAGTASAILLGGMAVTAAPALADEPSTDPVAAGCVYTYHAFLHGGDEAVLNAPLPEGVCFPDFGEVN